MITTESLASKSVKEVKEIIANLHQKAFDNIAMSQDMSTSIGKRMLEKRILARQNVREAYNGIKVAGRDPSDVVLELHSIQVHERLLSVDISEMEAVKKITESIDADLKICNTVLESKEARARTGR